MDSVDVTNGKNHIVHAGAMSTRGDEKVIQGTRSVICTSVSTIRLRWGLYKAQFQSLRIYAILDYKRKDFSTNSKYLKDGYNRKQEIIGITEILEWQCKKPQDVEEFGFRQEKNGS